jgi:hypothetical protein
MGIGVYLGWAWWAGPKHEKSTTEARYDPIYRAKVVAYGRARIVPYKRHENAHIFIRTHFIPHFHILDKEHKARDDAS